MSKVKTENLKKFQDMREQWASIRRLAGSTILELKKVDQAIWDKEDVLDAREDAFSDKMYGLYDLLSPEEKKAAHKIINKTPRSHIGITLDELKSGDVPNTI